MNSKFVASVFTFVAFALLSGSSPSASFARAPADAFVSTSHSATAAIEAYRFYSEVRAPDLQVPTVVEFPLAGKSFEMSLFLVQDITAGNFEPYLFNTNTTPLEVPQIITSEPQNQRSNAMLDGRYDTFADFFLPPSSQGAVEIQLQSTTPVKSSMLTIALANYVALPNSIEIVAMVDGEERIIVAKKSVGGNVVRFPETMSSLWKIRLVFSQPLRITELKLQNESRSKEVSNVLRFLAQPGHTYRVYYDADRYAVERVGEAGNLLGATDIERVTNFTTHPNEVYRIADVDADTIPDILDNCVEASNTDQLDINTNGRGDVCDDFDGDRDLNSKDNCPDNPNANQQDTDGDGKGDACDSEESRITEKYPWLPWLGIGFAAIVLISLFVLTAWSTSRGKNGLVGEPTTDPTAPPSDS